MCDPLCDFVRTQMEVVFMSDFVCFSSCLCLLSDPFSKTWDYMPSSNQRSLPHCPSSSLSPPYPYPHPQMVKTCRFKHQKFERHFSILLLIVLVNVLRVTLSFILNSYCSCCYSYCYYCYYCYYSCHHFYSYKYFSISTLLLVFYQVKNNME